MLILTRRLSERIIIGEGKNIIDINVLSIKGNQVRLGVTAPKEIPVHRDEIFQRIQQQKQDAVENDA